MRATPSQPVPAASPLRPSTPAPTSTPSQPSSASAHAHASRSPPRTRIDYRHPDRLLTYPHPRNLSTCEPRPRHPHVPARFKPGTCARRRQHTPTTPVHARHPTLTTRARSRSRSHARQRASPQHCTPIPTLPYECKRARDRFDAERESPLG